MLYALQHYTLNCAEPVKNKHTVSVIVLIRRLSTEILDNDDKLQISMALVNTFDMASTYPQLISVLRSFTYKDSVCGCQVERAHLSSSRGTSIH